MPRFELTLSDQRNLTAYLKRLGQERDPGVEEHILRLGTLLPASGPLAEAGRVVRAVLEDGLAQLNQQGGLHGRRLELVVLDPGHTPASAEQALERLLDDAQVFALIAPLAPMLDARLGSALEQRGVPLVGSSLAVSAVRRSSIRCQACPSNCRAWPVSPVTAWAWGLTGCG